MLVLFMEEETAAPVGNSGAMVTQKAAHIELTSVCQSNGGASGSEVIMYTH